MIPTLIAPVFIIFISFFVWDTILYAFMTVIDFVWMVFDD